MPISQLCSRCFGLALPYWTEEELGDVYYIIDLLAPVYYYFITKELWLYDSWGCKFMCLCLDSCKVDWCSNEHGYSACSRSIIADFETY